MFNLKNISRYKILNIVILLILIGITLGINYYFSKGYCLESCSYEFIAGWVSPFFEANNLLIIIFAIFLFLPSHYFRRWLWYIASWAVPVLLYFISAESVYTSNMMSGPDFIAGIGTVFLTVLSAVFVVGVFVFFQLQKYLKKNKK